MEIDPVLAGLAAGVTYNKFMRQLRLFTTAGWPHRLAFTLFRWGYVHRSVPITSWRVSGDGDLIFDLDVSCSEECRFETALVINLIVVFEW